MRVIVIGGTRFIGLATVKALHAAGHTVAVFNRGKTPGELPDGVQRITGDFNELDAAAAALRAFGPDIVLHNVVLNAGHVEAVQRVFTGVARRFVMTSSMDVYLMFGRVNGTDPGEPLPDPADESAPLRVSRFPYRANVPEGHPLQTYDKIPAEEACLASRDLAGTVVRLPMVYGPGDFQRRLYGWVRPMLDQRPAIVMDSDYAAWRSTYGYVENMAAALAHCCADDRAAGQTYNAADFSASMSEMAEKVRAVTGWTGRIITAAPDALPESLRAGVDPRHSIVAVAEKIKRDLGFTAPVSEDEAMRRAVAWEGATPPENPAAFPLRYEEQDAYLASQ